MAWDRSNLPIRPGVYVNFVDEALRAIQGGARGIVAIPLLSYDGTAEAKKFYTIERQSQANELLGSANSESIRLALESGANQVLVYTLPETPVEDDYDEYLEALETREFNVLVLDQDDDESLQTKVLAFVERMRDDEDIERHVMVVFGGSAEDDQDVTVGNTRTNLLKDDYSVNLITGVEIGDETLSSAEYAPAIAGLIAGTPINQTVTYKQMRVDDVSKRLRGSEIKIALQAGSFVLTHDGEKVIVEKGITTSGEHIRSIRTRQVILNDTKRFLKNEVIAKLDNNDDGRAAVIAILKRYTDGLEAMNAITDVNIYVDPDNPPQQDAAFFVIEYTDVYSLERVFLTVKRQG